MKKSLIIVTLLAVSLFLSNCAQRKVVQEPTGTPQEIEEEAVVRPGEEITEEKIREQELAKIETKDIEVPRYREEEIAFDDIHFDFDKYDIRSDAKPLLKSLADWLINNPSAEVVLEGHCDERGTNEYNLALGDRRAEATKDYLIALGIPSSRLETISYGEEKSLCTDKNEKCWQRNRRAHFVIVTER